MLSLGRIATRSVLRRPTRRTISYSGIQLMPQVPFKLADIGEGIAEVEVLQWFIKEGDTIKQFQNVCEVQSDKANVEITSRYDGVVAKIHYNTGEMAQVGSTLFDIDVDDDDLDIVPATPSPEPSNPVDVEILKSCSKSVAFKLADIGEGIAEVELMEWFVKEGDRVSQFQNLCQVQSDKATVEITSRYDGVIQRLHYDVGSMAQVGSTLVDIEVEGEVDASENIESAAAATPVVAVSPPAIGKRSAKNSKVLTTPSVRRLSKEHNIDLSTVQGTGPAGRILKGDLLKIIRSAAAGEAVEQQPASEPERQPITTSTEDDDAVPVPVSNQPVSTYLGQDTVVPIRGIQRMMVKSMNEALKIPHFGYADEIEMDALHELRTQLKPLASERNLSISYLPLMIKAASLALKEYPVLNSTLSSCESSITMLAAHNISVAMDTPRGLVVPNIKNVQSLSIFQIAEELNRLQELGSAGKLGECDLKGGTFSLSNIGSVGGTYMSPVILVPQVAIGAVGRIQTIPRFADDGSVKPIRLMNVSWSGDHRVIDGATMARFSNLWKSYLENPVTMLTELR